MPPGKKPKRPVKPAEQNAANDLKVRTAVEQNKAQMSNYFEAKQEATGEIAAKKKAAEQKKPSFWQNFRLRKSGKTQTNSAQIKTGEVARINAKKRTQQAAARQVEAAEQKILQKRAVQASSLPFFANAFGGKEKARNVFIKYYAYLSNSPKYTEIEIGVKTGLGDKLGFSETLFYSTLMTEIKAANAENKNLNTLKVVERIIALHVKAANIRKRQQ